MSIKRSKLLGLRLRADVTAKIEARIQEIKKMTGVEISKQKMIEAALSDVYMNSDSRVQS